MIVHWYHIPILDQSGSQYILAGAALVGRKEIIHIKNIFNFFSQTVKCLRTGITVICDQHGCLLVITHGINPGIRQHVQKNIPVLKKEGIVPGFSHAFKTLVNGRQV